MGPQAPPVTSEPQVDGKIKFGGALLQLEQRAFTSSQIQTNKTIGGANRTHGYMSPAPPRDTRLGHKVKLLWVRGAVVGPVDRLYFLASLTG